MVLSISAARAADSSAFKVCFLKSPVPLCVVFAIDDALCTDLEKLLGKQVVGF